MKFQITSTKSQTNHSKRFWSFEFGILKLFVICILWFVIFSLNEAHAALISKPPTNLGLVGYWSMNEGTGSYAGDSSGNKNTGTLTNGPTWVDGKRGKALNFDGGDDYVEIASSAVNVSGNVTVSMWARKGSVTLTFFSIRNNNTNVQVSANGDSGKNIACVSSTGSTNASGYRGSANDNQWYHVVCVYSSGTVSAAYLNGISQGTATSNWLIPASDTFRIGNRNGSSLYLNGSIDEVRVYNRALSASEIQALYKSGAQKFTAPPTNLGLVGYWSMNEGTGTVAGDGSGNGNRGTLTNGPTWVDGKRGKALNFDYVNDYVEAADKVSLRVGVPSFTFSAWLKPGNVSGCGADGTGPNCIIFNKENSYEWAISNNNNINWAIRNTSPGWAWRSSGLSAPTNTWTHIVITYNGSNIITYKNGGASTNSQSGSGNVDNTTYQNALRIGARNAPGAASAFFPGLIDEVRVYNRALSAAEVQALYKSGAQKFTAPPTNLGLVGYWSMNEGTGSYAGDSSGNRNQGTLTNGPTWVDGKRGKAINFDGSNDYVVSGAAFSDLGTTNKPYTLSAWIKANTGETTGNIINSYIAGLGGWRLGMVTLSTSKIVVNSWVGSRSTATSTTSITPGQWYHVVNTWDASGGLRIYINGAFDNSVAQATYSASGGSNVVSVALGALNGAAGSTENYFAGLIDEVRIYNRALSAAEIQALYKSGAGRIGL